MENGARTAPGETGTVPGGTGRVPGGTRTVAVVLALVVGLAVGFLIGRSQAPPPQTIPPTPVPTAPPPPSPTPTCLPAGAHQIRVGPNAGQVSEKSALISASEAGSGVTWIPADRTVTNLVITFDTAGFPAGANGEPPFTGGHTNVSQVFPCTSNVPCGPQGVNSNLRLPACPDYLYYKYTATWKVNGNDRKVDAGIIIER